MKNTIKNFITALIFPLFLISCSADEVEDLTSANYNAQMVKTFIYDSDLVGEWKLQSMVANKDIDLNGDGEQGANLINESSCFENITYTFRGNKTFTIINSTLELNSLNDVDDFKCQGASAISGKWSVKDDMLTLYIKINNQEYREQKHLILTEDTFFLEINKIESKDYIIDKGNSSAAGLSVVALEFGRTSKKV
mgnify:CR=1 FL=1